MEYLQINKYRIRIETNSNSLFNLFEMKETAKGKERETIIAYGISLSTSLKIIARDKTIKEEIKGYKEWITRFEDNLLKLEERLLPIDKRLREYLESQIPKKVMSDEHKAKLKEARNKKR